MGSNDLAARLGKTRLMLPMVLINRAGGGKRRSRLRANSELLLDHATAWKKHAPRRSSACGSRCRPPRPGHFVGEPASAARGSSSKSHAPFRVLGPD